MPRQALLRKGLVVGSFAEAWSILRSTYALDLLFFLSWRYGFFFAGNSILSFTRSFRAGTTRSFFHFYCRVALEFFR